MSMMSALILVGVSGFNFSAARAFCIELSINKIPQHKTMKDKAKKFKFDLKRCTFFIFACVSVIFVILQAPQNIDAKEILQFNRDAKNYNVKLQIVDSKQKEVAQFLVAIADSDAKKMYGLMNLEKLPQNHGMLFTFWRDAEITMWMKNTRIALDMLFIDSDNIIANVKTDAEPYSLEMIYSEKKVRKVLEINSGLVKKLGIKTGQKILISR